MTDLERILPLWREIDAAGQDYVLATVVALEGPSYRKPGACMLLTSDGRRAGTVSGGCLEAEVASRAWWLTANGPTVQRYSTAEDDGDRPYGSGCGGVVFLLLERRPTARPLLAALETAFHCRTQLAVATVLEGPEIGRRIFAGLDRDSPRNPPALVEPFPSADVFLHDFADSALESRSSLEKQLLVAGSEARVWANYRSARPGLWIFSAGDDAQPLLRLARELGWFVVVADGRSHLATLERFPLAHELHVLPIEELPGAQSPGQPNRPPAALHSLQPQDAAVVMTHSFEQDSRILASLLALETPPAYIGVLGPQRRTRELLAEAARMLNLHAKATMAQTERWLARLHAPTGLDLGAESPETVALSILAEIQKSFTAATALPLRKVRAAAPVPLGENALSKQHAS
jgi:xanthine/CO dehydrogenase XdhC/CoxF family maturation factor